MHVMHLPRDRLERRPPVVAGRTEPSVRLEENLGVTISTDNLRSAIKVCNRERKALKELHELNRHDPPYDWSGHAYNYLCERF